MPPIISRNRLTVATKPQPTENAGCTITLRIDSPKGDAIGTAVIKSTGSADKYKTFTTKVKGATGVHDLYLCFDKAQGDVRLDWWKFKK